MIGWWIGGGLLAWYLGTIPAAWFVAWTKSRLTKEELAALPPGIEARAIAGWPLLVLAFPAYLAMRAASRTKGGKRGSDKQ